MFQLIGSKYWSILGVVIACIIAEIVIGLIWRAFRKKDSDRAGKNMWQNISNPPLPIALISSVTAAPLIEELIFRGWLVVFFKEITFWSSFAIIIGGIIFGRLHRHGNLFVRMLESSHPEQAAVARNKFFSGARYFLTGALGILCGYLVVKYQSLYLGVLAHIAWNLIAMIAPIVFFPAFAALMLVLNKIVMRYGHIARCEDCGFYYAIPNKSIPPEELLRIAARNHDLYWENMIKQGREPPDRPCRRFHFITKGNEFTLMRSDEAPVRPIAKTAPPMNGLPPMFARTIPVKDLPLERLLRQAAAIISQEPGVAAEVNEFGDFCQAAVRRNEAGGVRESILIYRVLPENDGWTISVHGARRTSGMSGGYEVKMDIYIGRNDLGNRDIVIEKLIATF